MIKDIKVQVEYVHRLTEDVELRSGVVSQAGISVARGSDCYVRDRYSVFDGIGFTPIPPEKVKVYQVTTRTIVEEHPVDNEKPKDGSNPLSF